MTTSSIHPRPAPFIAVAAAVAVIAAGAVALSLSQDTDRPGAPGPASQTSVRYGAPRAHQFRPTTSGGRVVLDP